LVQRLSVVRGEANSVYEDHLLDCPGMDFNLPESVVQQHLRDHPGNVRCAICLARELYLLPGAIVPILATLAERQPPFAAGRCGCGVTAGGVKTYR
jgi:hypothetical protein